MFTLANVVPVIRLVKRIIVPIVFLTVQGTGVGNGLIAIRIIRIVGMKNVYVIQNGRPVIFIADLMMDFLQVLTAVLTHTNVTVQGIGL